MRRLGGVSSTLDRSQYDNKSFDIFWLKDESLEESKNLHGPHVIAQEIANDIVAP